MFLFLLNYSAKQIQITVIQVTIFQRSSPEFLQYRYPNNLRDYLNSQALRAILHYHFVIFLFLPSVKRLIWNSQLCLNV